MSMCETDLLIVGGGPAGLSAAINGASEGLVTRLLDGGHMLGGQARESASIENYPGFPEGVTGDELMGRFARQASKFETKMTCPVQAMRLCRDGDRLVIQTEDYQEHTARAVILANGLSYRRLQAEGIGAFMGRGVWYGTPPRPPHNKAKIVVVGGANSAGQAILNMASLNPRGTNRIMVRKALEDQMSTYLINRIRSPHSGIEVCEGCEVVATLGNTRLTHIRVRQGGREHDELCDYLLIYIGATPRTLWLDGTIDLDEKKFVKTGLDVVTGQMAPDRYCTSMQGVFAAGDVRLGSTKRIAAAIGEGAGALQTVHRYLARLQTAAQIQEVVNA